MHHLTHDMMCNYIILHSSRMVKYKQVSICSTQRKGSHDTSVLPVCVGKGMEGRRKSSQIVES